MLALPQSLYQQRLDPGRRRVRGARAAGSACSPRPAGGGQGFSCPSMKKKPVPREVYLYGPVGRGKSMLLDLVFEVAPVERSRVSTSTPSWPGCRLIDWLAQGRRPYPAGGCFGEAKGDGPIRAGRRADRGTMSCSCLSTSSTSPASPTPCCWAWLFEALFAQGRGGGRHLQPRARPPLYRNGINR